MIPAKRPPWSYRLSGTAALGALFALLLFSRRPAQLLSPQVWNEDGTHVLAGLLARGWASLVEPVNGLVIVVPRLVSAVSLWISFYHYPLVSTLISWSLIVAVGIAIARSPTTLRARAWCAVAVFLVPSDPEVFGLPLYTFWWTTLLLLLASVWNDEGKGRYLRLGFILLGGLSSPVVALIVPVLVVRAFAARAPRDEQVAAALAATLACFQLFYVVKQGLGPYAPTLSSLAINTLPVMVGKFAIGSWTGNKALLWVAAVVLLGIAAVHGLKDGERRTFWTLAYLLGGAIALSAGRVDPVYLEPRTVGPRYFFLPFVLLSWLLVQCAAAALRSPRGMLATVGLLAAAVNAVPGWSRSHGDLHWGDIVRTCARFPDYAIPVHFDGNPAKAWHFWLPGRVCADRMSKGLWPAPVDVASLPTLPYLKRDMAHARPGAEWGELVSATMQGADADRSSLPGYRVIGSFHGSDADVGDVKIRMSRGGQLRFRSGPVASGQVLTIVGHEAAFATRVPASPEWVMLDFSNSALPEQFVVRIEDRGRAPGEWSAVAIKAP